MFQNAALGMFSLIAETGQVGEAQEFPVALEAEDRETLLVEWLNELLYIFESREVLLSRFEIMELGETHLKGLAHGETVNAARHGLKADIKAATYHMLKIVESPDGWQAEVIFDV